MKYLRIMALALGALVFSSNISLYGLNIIPKPVSITIEKGNFYIGSKTRILYNFKDKSIENITSPLLNHLKNFYGIVALPVIYSAKSEKHSVYLSLNPAAAIQKEGYRLDVTREGITLEASTPNGLFYGIQSLIQMMPASKENAKKISVPLAHIVDYPRFQWRGLHLDVCRHFMPKEFVLRYIDYMSMHKFNTFHFHLTEDQGWRIEIKKYPLLTKTGSVRKETIVGSNRLSKVFDGTPHGGFYTQDDIREIVEYAAKRYVTVVPEIEMPGHALAALASYPYLGCTGGPYEVCTRWGVWKDVMCAGRESTFAFLQDVLDEVLTLFPSEYIHIGGDECPKESWKQCPVCQQRIAAEGLKDEHELQSYFIQRIERYINSKGRKIIGWDEILEGGLAPNAAVMSWRGEDGGIAAAKQQHFVVMSPGTYCYLDHYQAEPKTQPFAIGGFTPLEKIYSYEPVPSTLTQEESAYIMGAQGNVWTEYMATEKHVEYMVYPRAAALAEVVWSPKESRNYPDFMLRMKEQTKRYDVYGINYCKVAFE